MYTSADLGVAPHQGFVTVHPDFARPPLADGVVRFVGEAIAIVIGETVTAAADGAAAVWADYEPLGAIVDAETAFDDDAPLIFPDHGSNQAMVVTDAVAVDLERDQRRRRARPLRQPARRRRPDGDQRVPRHPR